MKPTALEIEGFKSYKERQFIDFASLGQEGLFGIFGKTGSGKSTVLDALMFALFGGESREIAPLINSQSNSARVTFTFEMQEGNARYLYEAIREIKRNKGREGATTSYCRLMRKDAMDTVLASDRADQMNKAVKDLLKLERDEFCKTVVLPQGQFADFLKLSSKLRNDLLEKLFMLERYGTRLEERARKEKDASTAKANLMREKLASLQYASDEELASRRKKESIERASLEGLKQKLAASEPEFKALEEGCRLTQEWEKYSARQKELAAFEKDMESKKTILLNAERAAKAMPFVEAERAARGEAGKAALTKTELLAGAKEIENRKNLAAERFSTVEKEKNGHENVLRSKHSAMERLYTLKRNVLENEKKLVEAQKECASLQSRHDEYKSRSEESEKAFNDARETNFAIFTAGKLRDGQACPVCGSTHHPDKAHGLLIDFKKLDEERRNLKDAYAKAQQELNAAHKKEAECQGMAAQMKAGLESIQNELNLLDAEGARKILQLDNEELPKLITQTKETLERILADHDAALREKQEAEKAFNTRSAALAEADGRAKACDAALERAVAGCATALAGQGFKTAEEVLAAALPTAEMAALKKALEDYAEQKRECDFNLRSLEAKLQGKRVSIQAYEQAKAARQELNTQLETSIAALAGLQNEIGRMEKDNAALAITQSLVKSVETELATIEDLSRAIRGKAFVEYASGRLMQSIVHEASCQLDKLSSGRYEFYYNYSTGFFVRDNFNGGLERGASTLSGGETFLLSLTLALALAAHISRQSHPFEFFFLDEGFGTLDTELLETVMDALESLKSQNLTIGLITHNDEIQKRMSRKLIVEQPNVARGTVVSIPK